MQCLVKVATCNLNQWAMDFDLNLHNIRRSIEIAKGQGARLRLGPELEISGYGCEDHFLEQDTYYHSWKSLAAILDSSLTCNILCDIGMAVVHNNSRYNCRVFVVDKKIVLIRPKMHLANDGNYREARWFCSWTRLDGVDQHIVPKFISDITGDESVPFGAAILQLRDTSIGVELCEELFTPDSPHISLSLNGVEIILNGSGSHHNLRKLDDRLKLITSAVRKCGGLYLYANQRGCDGGRLYYDGCALICLNGNVLAQGSQFAITDVEVATAVVDLEDIRSYRGCISSRSQQSSSVKRLPVVNNSFALHRSSEKPSHDIPTPTKELKYHTVEEEIALSASCWLWDYLRRSNASGFFLPLSGGADSAAVASLVGVMCQNVMAAVTSGDPVVMSDLQRILTQSVSMPSSAKDLVRLLFTTTYMGTSNSSFETQRRAEKLAEEIGTNHIYVNIDAIVNVFLSLFSSLFGGKVPSFTGDKVENVALQNLQARCRMVLSFMMAQLLPWTKGKFGFLIVLGCSNVDEALRGYMTKYDCSSADINPIGGISKTDLRKFLLWAKSSMGYESLQSILDAPPSAELQPISESYSQTDEADMGMTYEELSIFGRLRSIERCGPLSMYRKLKYLWGHYKPSLIAIKVKKFFYHYSANRHKMTVLTPALHAENYSPDDNRFDLRQFLYNTLWPAQFRAIDELAATDEMVMEHKRD
uniref:Glutamine-dependent NAD(+) synthetase n=1 Tax=Spongospora subterranea TaxID=70186 RepID=A0A0H5QRG6_9EUKA|eukprot:CRZ04217.1 hypothetical protein [Spongospora subterranea]